MNTDYILLVMIIYVLVKEFLWNRKEQKLLDRIMSKDYGEYRAGSVKHKKPEYPPSLFDDEAEADMEAQLRGLEKKSDSLVGDMYTKV